MDLMKSLEFVPLVEEQKVVTKENLQELVNDIIDSKVITKDVKIVNSNKAITDYSKKVNRIKKRDSKPSEADLSRIALAQKEREAKWQKNLIQVGK